MGGKDSKPVFVTYEDALERGITTSLNLGTFLSRAASRHADSVNCGD